MPIYEYKCKACGHEWESMQPISKADDALPCPACETPTTQSIGAPLLKWYPGCPRPFFKEKYKGV